MASGEGRRRDVEEERCLALDGSGVSKVVGGESEAVIAGVDCEASAWVGGGGGGVGDELESTTDGFVRFVATSASASAFRAAKLRAPYAWMRERMAICSLASCSPSGDGGLLASVCRAACCSRCRFAAAARALCECGGGTSVFRSSFSSSREIVWPPEGAGSGSVKKEDRNEDLAVAGPSVGSS